MEEQMKPGEYTALGVMNIRASMVTNISVNLVGGYRNGQPFTVYQVYPEQNGIVWGRVSSNTGEGQARYVALRVNQNAKAKMERAFDEEPEPSPNVEVWINSVDQWARSKGFTGPHPF